MIYLVINGEQRAYECVEAAYENREAAVHYLWLRYLDEMREAKNTYFLYTRDSIEDRTEDYLWIQEVKTGHQVTYEYAKAAVDWHEKSMTNDYEYARNI